MRRRPAAPSRPAVPSRLDLRSGLCLRPKSERRRRAGYRPRVPATHPARLGEGDALRGGGGGARRSHVAGGEATWRARRRRIRRRCQRFQPPPKSGEGSESNLKLLAPTWEAQTSPSSPRLLLSHGERLRAEDPDLLQEKARLTAGGTQPLPPSSLPTRNRWGREKAEQVAASSDQGPQVNNSGREIVDFCFQAFACRMQTTHLLIFFFFFCLLSSRCRE